MRIAQSNKGYHTVPVVPRELKIKLYVVDVDYESFGYDIIIYNYTGSNSYGNYIAFSDIDSIELDKDGVTHGKG